LPDAVEQVWRFLDGLVRPRRSVTAGAAVGRTAILPLAWSGAASSNLTDTWEVQRLLVARFADQWTVAAPPGVGTSLEDQWTVLAQLMPFRDQWRVVPPELPVLFSADVQRPARSATKSP
jgi:hypothetical protein